MVTEVSDPCQEVSLNLENYAVFSVQKRDETGGNWARECASIPVLSKSFGRLLRMRYTVAGGKFAAMAPRHLAWSPRRSRIARASLRKIASFSKP